MEHTHTDRLAKQMTEYGNIYSRFTQNFGMGFKRLLDNTCCLIRICLGGRIAGFCVLMTQICPASTLFDRPTENIFNEAIEYIQSLFRYYETLHITEKWNAVMLYVKVLVVKFRDSVFI